MTYADNDCPSRFHSDRGVVHCTMPLDRHVDEGRDTKHLAGRSRFDEPAVYWRTHQQIKEPHRG